MGINMFAGGLGGGRGAGGATDININLDVRDCFLFFCYQKKISKFFVKVTEITQVMLQGGYGGGGMGMGGAYGPGGAGIMGPGGAGGAGGAGGGTVAFFFKKKASSFSRRWSRGRLWSGRSNVRGRSRAGRRWRSVILFLCPTYPLSLRRKCELFSKKYFQPEAHTVRAVSIWAGPMVATDQEQEPEAVATPTSTLTSEEVVVRVERAPVGLEALEQVREPLYREYFWLIG